MKNSVVKEPIPPNREAHRAKVAPVAQSGPQSETLEQTWRVFCAIEMPEEISRQGTAHIQRLRRAFPNTVASWNHDGQFHLTIKFLGEITQQQVGAVFRAASRAVSRFSPFTITVKAPGTFPEHGPPRVLWLGITDTSSKLRELQTSLEQECEREGFPREERSFHPHLTLARVRKAQGTRALAIAHRELDFRPLDVVVSELLVYRSERGEEGSQHTVISRHPFESVSTVTR